VPLEVEILTPSRLLVHEQVDELNVPGALGYLGILPGHTALLTVLGQGELMYRQGTARHYIAIFGGHMEVNNDKVIILADQAETAREIDRARAEASRDRAEARLRRFDDSTLDRERARMALERAQIRLHVATQSS
jgi:F-type H+-transporting ATPase subunit epsilon